MASDNTASTNWRAITPSAFAWEQDALSFVREHFPSHEPYRAWSNFEFIADDGSHNEVDLLVFTPVGLFLIEIKSNPGLLTGDAGTWTWQHEGRTKTVDNPLLLANLKAKRLASLLERQRAFERQRRPFIDALVFCSAPNLQCQLEGNGRFRVCLRDQEDRAGIMAAIKRRQCSGLPEQPKGTFDRPTAKAVARALEQAGIRPSQRFRRVGDYELVEPLDQGPGYQDFLARHVGLPDTQRRIRIYQVQLGASEEQRRTLQRAAEREFRLLQAIEHRGILRAMDFTTHDLGPAIIFQHHPEAIRLDHFLAQRQGQLTDDLRLGIMRQVADTIRFAHEKHVVHRGLSPRCVLLVRPNSDAPQAIIMNWQLGYRQPSTQAPALTAAPVTATQHVDSLVDEPSRIYMAPESLADAQQLGEHQDIFSLGALCYHLFTGQAPAADAAALAEKLRATGGLSVSAVLNGTVQSLQDLVRYSTDPDVSNRLDTAEEFLDLLNKVLDELTTPPDQFTGDPAQASTGTVLPGGYEVIKQLGTGSTATALLVKKDGREYVLKISVDVEHNDRVRNEGQIIQRLDSPLVVKCHDIITLVDRVTLVLDRAGDSTLGQRIRRDGRLSLDLLQRFGEDLLRAVQLLEEKGINHRDIKPDNIGVSLVGRSALHLVLFDFSLSLCPADNIRAGTPGYLDPLLPLRKPPRWDLQAERYAAAVTLYQMAAGSMPVWYDGQTSPDMVECEITLEPEQFDANLRDALTKFFRQALRRNPRARFDNASQMLSSWRHLFAGTQTATTVAATGEPDNAAALAAATLDTNISELGLGPSAVDALDRINVVKVRELLATHGRRLSRMRGVGNKTRKRILAAAKVLRQRLGPTDSPETPSTTSDEPLTALAGFGTDKAPIDILVGRITRAKAKSRNATENTAIEALLGKDSRIATLWPNQGEAAAVAGVTRGRVSQILKEAAGRWVRDPEITLVRQDIEKLLQENGNAMGAAEVADVLIEQRGCTVDGPERRRMGMVVVRAAFEAENLRDEPGFFLRRDDNSAILATDPSLLDFGAALGHKADAIAAADPLTPPARVIELLREVPPPVEAEPLTDARLLRLAAAAARTAAISAKGELYPRGMDAGRALKLSMGALSGARMLTLENIRQRVSSRYPEAQALPGRPALDRLLQDAGLEVTWHTSSSGVSSYVSTAPNPFSVTSPTAPVARRATLNPTPTFRAVDVPPEISEARAFEQRLRIAERDGAFLAMTVAPGEYRRACQEIAGRFSVEPLDLEKVFIEALRAAADEVGAVWDIVIAADATGPSSADWRNLNLLIADHVMPKVEKVIMARSKTVLIYHLNWLARYGQIPFLAALQQAVQTETLRGAWLLIPENPQTQMPLLDGKAVPVITNAQWAHIPESWCRNEHRAVAARPAIESSFFQSREGAPG